MFGWAALNFSIQTWYSNAGNVAPAPVSVTLALGTAGPVVADWPATADWPAAPVGLVVGPAAALQAPASTVAASSRAFARRLGMGVTRCNLQGAIVRSSPGGLPRPVNSPSAAC